MTRTALATAALLLAAPTAPAADPPRVVRENIEWLDVWVPGNAVKDQPRVLLIGSAYVDLVSMWRAPSLAASSGVFPCWRATM